MKNACIYCGVTDDLSKSDILPDALTNTKIINPNVCRIEHNNKFSDMFESEVIKKLAFITNELDIKSSKSKKYAAYEANISIGDNNYKTKLSSDVEIFGGNKMMRSVDGKYLVGKIDELRKIKDANDKNVNEIDITQIEIKTSVNLELSVFFSNSMFRLAAKIAFEWYCVRNRVTSKENDFLSIINFITMNTGDGIVSIVSNPEIYQFFNITVNFGSHALLSYIAQDKSINVLVNLFGIAVYNVRICDSVSVTCKYNALFQELTLDSKYYSFEYTDIDSLQKSIINSFEPTKIGQGITAMIPKDMTDLTLKQKVIYANYYNLFLNELNLIVEPTEDVISLMLEKIENLLKESVISIKGLKRFVKDHQQQLKEGIRLNPKGTNKKSIMMFYILFTIGRSNEKIKNMNDLNTTLKEKFEGDTIVITDDLSGILFEEMLADESRSELITKGAKTVENWGYK